MLTAAGIDRRPRRRPRPRRRRLPAQAVRVRRARRAGPRARPALGRRRSRRCSCTATCASIPPIASPPAAGERLALSPKEFAVLEYLLARRGPRRLGRGAAGAGLGRERRPVHHHRQGHDQPAARKARRAAADRDRVAAAATGSERAMAAPTRSRPQPASALAAGSGRRRPRLPRYTIRLRLTVALRRRVSDLGNACCSRIIFAGRPTLLAQRGRLRHKGRRGSSSDDAGLPRGPVGPTPPVDARRPRSSDPPRLRPSSSRRWRSTSTTATCTSC